MSEDQKISLEERVKQHYLGVLYDAGFPLGVNSRAKVINYKPGEAFDFRKQRD